MARRSVPFEPAAQGVNPVVSRHHRGITLTRVDGSRGEGASLNGAVSPLRCGPGASFPEVLSRRVLAVALLAVAAVVAVVVALTQLLPGGSAAPPRIQPARPATTSTTPAGP